MFDTRSTATPSERGEPTPAPPGGSDPAGLVAGLESAAAGLCATAPGAVGAGERLDVVGRALVAVDRVMAAVVALVGAAGSNPATLGAAGLTLPAWLRALAGRTSGDERMLLAAAERLAHLPVVAGLFAQGRLSWGVVRAVVSATRVLNRAQLEWLDAVVDANRTRLVAMDPDEVVAAVDELVEAARPELVKDRAERRYESRFVQVQPGLDGSLALYAELDAEAGAVVLEALETAVDPADAPDREHEHAGDDPRTDGHGRHDDDAGAAPPPERERRARGRARADALVALCHRPDAGAPARPSLLVLTDVDTLAGGVASRAAQLLWRGSRGPVRVTAEAARRLSCDADLRPLLTDGALPLGAGRRSRVVPANVRDALVARDGGCRFPGCAHPVQRCHAHHARHWLHGGRTDPDNLILLCQAHHRAVHEGGWRLQPHPDGRVVFSRRRHTLTSLPRAQRRLAPSRPPPARMRRSRGSQAGGRAHAPPVPV